MPEPTGNTSEGSLQPASAPAPAYEVEFKALHAARPGFRINELRISPTQSVPWHYHNHIQDAFYVVEGRIRIFLRAPDEQVELGPSELYSIPPLRPHCITNAGPTSATFLNLQGIGEYDFIPVKEGPDARG
jgi:mannose-6-phosphate isomerase-like protein (cupin superfamily)